MRLWPDSLAGRTLALLVGMTLLLITGSAILVNNERHERFIEREQFHLVERVMTQVRLLSQATDGERDKLIKRISRPGEQIRLDKAPLIAAGRGHPLELRLANRLKRELDLDDVRVRLSHRKPNQVPGLKPPPPDDHRKPSRPMLRSITLSAQLSDGSWLNIQAGGPEATPPWRSLTLQLLLLLLLVVIVSGLFIARRMAKPMSQLAEAATQFGLEFKVSPLPEEGPREVRNTIHAFNQMQERLQRHITERSQMLAAVSHDLRTPITTLRLRAEYIEEDEIREKTLATLAEMETILSATLSFARNEAREELSRSTDIAALLTALVDDFTDLGAEIDYTGPDRLVTRCRPVALKRALSNLLDNARKYGGTTHIRLQLASDTGDLVICIEDEGPGIPESHLEQVFTPFYRLEKSRNRETGGTGLGLASARSAIQAQGGSLVLSNRPEGGLRASIRLPVPK